MILTNIGMTVADLDKGLTLIQDSQDIDAVFDSIHLDTIRKSKDDFWHECLLVRVHEGEYVKVYGCSTYIPYLNSNVEVIK